MLSILPTFQPEAGGNDAAVAAMWQQLTTQGPRNAVWVLAPQRPLSAWAAVAAAESLSNSSSSFGVSGEVCVFPSVQAVTD